jgi:hypothetical protein
MMIFVFARNVLMQVTAVRNFSLGLAAKEKVIYGRDWFWKGIFERDRRFGDE